MMSEHVVFSEEMREIVESFVLETQEIFDELNDDLLRLENADDPAPLVDKVFRAVHTVKGTSSFLGLDQLNELAHHFEDVLNRLRKGELTFEADMMDILFAAFDQMTVLLQQVLDGDIAPLPLDGLLADLKDLASRANSPNNSRRTERTESVGPTDRDSDNVPLATPPIDTPDRTPKRSDASAERVRRAGASVRVDIARLDDLLELVGELAQSRCRLEHAVQSLSAGPHRGDELAGVVGASEQIRVLLSELRAAVLQTRMVPIERVFSKFPRVARDLGRSLDKSIEIVVEGAETELDKSLVDEIGEPLLHLIRNAIDHGIEPRNERRSNGKPEDGRITLSAEQHGNIICVSVSDDGSGIDASKIRQKAVSGGLISPEEAERLDDQAIFDLIWRPGFTTTDHVSRLSGRGVGMDVVMTTVRRLNGDVQVDSKQGTGTRFTLRLPLSLATLRGVLIESQQDTYVLPFPAIVEIVPLVETGWTGGERLVRYRTDTIPLIRVADGKAVAPEKDVGALVAVLKGAENLYGLVIDELEGQEDVLVKPVPTGDAPSWVFAGSAGLADGRSAMVLDTDRLGAKALKIRKKYRGESDPLHDRYAASPST